jgi:DNA-binding XRE family transcriptional regulator
LERYKSRLKEIRKEVGLTVSELSAATGVGERTIVSIETKQGCNPSVGTVLRLMKYLKINFEDLLQQIVTYRFLRNGN